MPYFRSTWEEASFERAYYDQKMYEEEMGWEDEPDWNMMAQAESEVGRQGTAMEVDEDGWTTVVSKRSKRSKKQSR